MKTVYALLVSATLSLSLCACSSVPPTSLADACANGLDQAFAELHDARAKGFSGSVSWIKAAGLLSAAKVQQEFEKYPNCINKVQRARRYISLARQGK